jgi:hypothetical protein
MVNGLLEQPRYHLSLLNQVREGVLLDVQSHKLEKFIKNRNVCLQLLKPYYFYWWLLSWIRIQKLRMFQFLSSLFNWHGAFSVTYTSACLESFIANWMACLEFSFQFDWLKYCGIIMFELICYAGSSYEVFTLLSWVSSLLFVSLFGHKICILSKSTSVQAIFYFNLQTIKASSWPIILLGSKTQTWTAVAHLKLLQLLVSTILCGYDPKIICK